MSEEQNEQRGLAGVPSRIANWLRSFVGRGSQERGVVESAAPMATPDLLQHAARCYAAAGWADDACRVFEHLGDDGQAARYHEQLERWKEAALGYARVADWSSAARCYLKSDQPNEAAECLLKAGQTLEAAWLWADQAQRFRRAETALQQANPEAEADRLAVELVLARCEVGTGATSEAGKRLRNVLSQLRDLPPTINRRRLHNWAFAVAEALRRPDLTAQLHAVAVSSSLPRSHERWERWAIEMLDDATGVPGRENEQ